MWTKKKEQKFVNKIKERKEELLDIMKFIEIQLIEYAARIDYDFFEYEHDNSTELIDFFEWYMDEKLHEVVEMDICINVINFLFFKDFDVYMFEAEDDNNE